MGAAEMLVEVHPQELKFTCKYRSDMVFLFVSDEDVLLTVIAVVALL